MIRLIVYLVLMIVFMSPAISIADSQKQYTIIIKDHKFDPVQLVVPAGQKVKLTIDNQDPTPEEFESFELNREKVVAGHKKIIVYLGPLKPGNYKYFGEFNKQTAQGIITAQ